MSLITLYLSLPPTVSFSTLQIAAEITLDGATYTTNDRDAVAGGHVSNGGFNSSILIKPMVPYILKAEDFVIVSNPGIGYWKYPGYTGGERVLDLWIISLKHGYRILESDIPNERPIPWFSQYVRSGNDLDTGHWALPVLPAWSTVYLGWNRVGGSTTLDCAVQPYAGTGDAYAVIEKAHSFQIHSYNHKRIAYIDNNGCSHSVVLRPNNNGTTFQIDDN